MTADAEHVLPPAVSVVVPVYNPGRYLERCIDSILHQSLPSDSLEAILVDDGSTDGSDARLDAIAARHPHVRVIHQENSGWPGKPRNVGMDAARGDYIFFADADDRLGDEALERMHAIAVRTGRDIVLGKIVGHHRGVPRRLFEADLDHATLWDSALIDSMTACKLFRRSFLLEHGLRFPEGRRRLEDHSFVLRSYFAADAVAILSSYDCYFAYRRDDGGNITRAALDPPYYYGFVREILQIVEAHTASGPARDSLLQRYARVELLGRLRNAAFLAASDDDRRVLLDEIRGVITDHIPETVDALLPPRDRIAMGLVRAGRLGLLVELAKAADRMVVVTDVTACEGTPRGAISLRFGATLTADPSPLRADTRADPALAVVSPDVDAASSDTARRADARVTGSVEVLLRRRDDSAELPVPAVVERELDTSDPGSSKIGYHVHAIVDPETIAHGSPIAPATWDVLVRIAEFGFEREGRLRRPNGDDSAGHPAVAVTAAAAKGPRVWARAYWTTRTSQLAIVTKPAREQAIIRRAWRRLSRSLLR